MKRLLLSVLVVLTIAAPVTADAAQLLVPMDESQTNHLKAYGLAFKVLKKGQPISWMLNYRGGSFLMPASGFVDVEARLMGVKLERVSAADVAAIRRTVAEENMDEVLLEVPPRIAIYAPPNHQPWDDAVTLALTYAEIDFDTIFDTEVLAGELANYDWLHLHHEDFTGQYGKFWASYHNTQWYQDQVREQEEMARANGFQKVSEMKLAVALKIREFASGGGFLFAMCSATDSYDIALAAANTDICEHMYDGDGRDPDYRSKLDFSQTLAFHNFQIEQNPHRALQR